MEKMLTTRENRKITEMELSELKEKKAQLSTDIAKLQTESGVEENIRDKFGLAKEGEGLIVVVEDKNKAEAEEEKPGWFESLWNKLFK